MQNDELNKLLEDDEEWIRMQLSNEPEIDSIQQILKRYVKDLEELSTTNTELKSEVLEMIKNYEESNMKYLELKKAN